MKLCLEKKSENIKIKDKFIFLLCGQAWHIWHSGITVIKRVGYIMCYRCATFKVSLCQLIVLSVLSCRGEILKNLFPSYNRVSRVTLFGGVCMWPSNTRHYVGRHLIWDLHSACITFLWQLSRITTHFELKSIQIHICSLTFHRSEHEINFTGWYKSLGKSTYDPRGSRGRL